MLNYINKIIISFSALILSQNYKSNFMIVKHSFGIFYSLSNNKNNNNIFFEKIKVIIKQKKNEIESENEKVITIIESI